jgi:hypothetical protein
VRAVLLDAFGTSAAGLVVLSAAFAAWEWVA